LSERRARSRVVCFVLLSAIAAACTHAETKGSAPQSIQRSGVIERSPGSSLLAVDGTGGADVWAVGEVHAPDPNRERSLIEHWDGKRWSVVVAPDAGRLMSVSAITPDDAWALGARSLLRWDGTSWVEVLLPAGSGASFDSLSASGPENVWIAGTRPGPFIGNNTRGSSTVVAHYDGIGWTVMHPPNPGTSVNNLQGVIASSPTDVWAAGYSSDRGKSSAEATSLIEHWDGRSWTAVSSPDPSLSLNVIWGAGWDGGSGVWALGHYMAPDHHLHALVLRWNGMRWEQIEVVGVSTWSATAASGVSAGEVWVVGSEPTSSLAIARCSAGACRTVVNPAQSSDRVANSVYAAGPEDAWIVGVASSVSSHYGSGPFVEHWNGDTWTEVQPPSGLPRTT
jgi:hypothetical protein